MSDTLIKTVICCGICDARVVSTYGELDYIDKAGVITAYCAKHA